MTDIKIFKIKFFQGFTAKQIIKDMPEFEHYSMDGLVDKRNKQGIVYVETRDFDLEELCIRLWNTKDKMLMEFCNEIHRISNEFDYLYSQQLKKKALTGDWVDKL